jgi:hypothetical protein
MSGQRSRIVEAERELEKLMNSVTAECQRVFGSVDIPVSPLESLEASVEVRTPENYPKIGGRPARQIWVYTKFRDFLFDEAHEGPVHPRKVINDIIKWYRRRSR